MTVLVAHPLPPVVDGLVGVLRTRLDCRSVEGATSRAEVFRRAASGGVEAALVHALLAPGEEASLCEGLAGHGVATVLMTQGEGGYLGCLTAGARGVTPAEDGVDGAVRALETVLSGNMYVPSHLLGAVLAEVIALQRADDVRTTQVDRLSPRERQVLGLLGEGADHVEIASRLTISPNTAKTHINRLLTKLDLRSRVEAASLAAAHGIILLRRRRLPHDPLDLLPPARRSGRRRDLSGILTARSSPRSGETWSSTPRRSPCGSSATAETDVEEMLSAVCELFAVDRERARSDVRHALAELAELGVIR